RASIFVRAGGVLWRVRSPRGGAVNLREIDSRNGRPQIAITTPFAHASSEKGYLLRLCQRLKHVATDVGTIHLEPEMWPRIDVARLRPRHPQWPLPADPSHVLAPAAADADPRVPFLAGEGSYESALERVLACKWPSPLQ